ncbi:MAG: carbon-nitrogen hydrolase family protein [Dehalococcoidia bacterium]|nr:carbon-nitrogen hydrolase family protein [Dehalococcoidia bacterium]
MTAPAPFKIAAVQASPVFLDREATVEKACDLIARAAAEGARLVVFPEAFVPAYPDWIWALPPGEYGTLSDLYSQLLDQSVTIPSATTKRLGEAAREAGAYVAIGVNERNSEASNATLYNTLLYLDDQGRVMGKHRKLVPTAAERLVWAHGDGSTLDVYDTALGRLGGLICWENYMPLARYAMYARGVQVYLAPTWDRSEPWLSTLRHIAREGRAYVVGCCIAMRRSDIPPAIAERVPYPDDGKEWINVGDSAIVDPEGRFVAGPLRAAEDILYAEVDPKQLTGPKWMLDVAGHYGRPDVFKLSVNTAPNHMLLTADGVTGLEGDAASSEHEQELAN